MSDISVETTRAVWLDKEGVCIKVGVDRDVGELVEVYTDGKSEEYFGPTRLVMSPELALQVGKVIVTQAQELIERDRERGRLHP